MSAFTLEEKVEVELNKFSNNQNAKILFVLDGYDEYNDKHSKIVPDIIPLATYPNTKVIMTTRENYADYKDYTHCFGINTRYQINYICPFNDAQRNEYIRRFVHTVQSLKKYYLDFDSLDSVAAYEKYFSDYSVLYELTQVPFTLRIVMNILPLLVEAIKQQRAQSQSTVNNVYLSRQQIFSIFVEFYYKNEIKRLAHDVAVQELL